MPEISDLKGKVAGERGGLEKLLDIVPGYRGYKEKEMRRQADRLLREHLARGFQAERERLGQVQIQLIEARKMASFIALDQAEMRLQTLISRVKLAPTGYSGWFDAVRVREEELDALYSFDLAMAEGVARLKGAMDVLVEAANKDAEVSTPAKEVLALVGELSATWQKREDVVIGAV